MRLSASHMCGSPGSSRVTPNLAEFVVIVASTMARFQPQPPVLEASFVYRNCGHGDEVEEVELWHVFDVTYGCWRRQCVYDCSVFDHSGNRLWHTRTMPHGAWRFLEIPSPGIRMQFDYKGDISKMQYYAKETTVWWQPPRMQEFGEYMGKDYKGRTIYLQTMFRRAVTDASVTTRL